MLIFDDQAGLSDQAKRLLLVDHLIEVRRLAVEILGELPRPLATEIASQALDLPTGQAGLAVEQCGPTAVTAAACEATCLTCLPDRQAGRQVAEHCGTTLDN